MLNDHIHVVHMNEASSQDPRHHGVHLGNDKIGRHRSSHGDVNRNPEAHPSEVIRGRHLNECNVNGELSAFEEAGHGREVYGGHKADIACETLRLG